VSTVFISSTILDLEEYRQAVVMAANAADLGADLQENWTAEDHPPLDACLERVREAQVLVVIVAYRYGWVPEDPSRNPEGKSITWLECEEAEAKGKQILAFVVDDDANWPDAKKDEVDLKQAMEDEDDERAGAVYESVRARIKGLKAFKQWLDSRGLCRSFRTKEELKLEVERALRHWSSQRAADALGPQTQHRVVQPIPFDYLQWLRRECEAVKFLGLEAQKRQPSQLSQIYVPAVTRGDLLLNRLGDESLYVPGDPGSGKSTFCRWLTLAAASNILPAHHSIPDPEAFREIFPQSFRNRLPVLVPLGEFWQSLRLERGIRQLSREGLVIALGRWLEARAGAERMPAEVFSDLFCRGRALLILDGVDEVPLTDGDVRRRIYPRACLLAGLADGRDYWTRAGNRILVTSRRYGLQSADVNRLGLTEAPLSELEDELQFLFIRRWYAATDPGRAEEDAKGLIDLLAERPELRRNPMLLTALCVRYSEGRSLPEDQHDLYDKMINNVLFNRYRDNNPERAKVRGRLAAIALGMHTGDGIQINRITPEAAVSLDEVEHILADYAQLSPATEAGRTAAAERRDELLANSGLLVSSASDKARFYHFSFQEFLAAEHLAQTRREPDWFETVVRQRSLVSGWRLTLGFLFSRMLERNREQWALEAAERLLKLQDRDALRDNPAGAVICADWIEVLQRKRVNLGSLKEGYTKLTLTAIVDEIPLRERLHLVRILGLIGDPRVGNPRDSLWRKDGLVKVPAGSYAYQDGHREIEQPFLIGRYPVTNAQFAVFIEDGGYQNEKWWSGAGWRWRKHSAINEPEYWHDNKFNARNQPVVGVSFWEAEAFCSWALGRLPTDHEWEAAARGPNGYEYPWGGSWEDGICNTHEADLRRTAPVGLFPRSTQKELGIEDMAGNVWEWCRNDYGNGQRTAFTRDESPILRGGSWLDFRNLALADYRITKGNPNSRYSYYGFRLVSACDTVSSAFDAQTTMGSV